MQTHRERGTDSHMYGRAGRTNFYCTDDRRKWKLKSGKINSQYRWAKFLPRQIYSNGNGIARNQRRRRQRRRRRLNSDSMESDEERCSHVTHVKWHWNWKWSYFTFHSYNSTTITTTTTVTAPPSWRWFLYILPMVVQWVMEQYLGYTAVYTILRWHLLF